MEFNLLNKNELKFNINNEKVINYSDEEKLELHFQ